MEIWQQRNRWHIVSLKLLYYTQTETHLANIIHWSTMHQRRKGRVSISIMCRQMNEAWSSDIVISTKVSVGPLINGNGDVIRVDRYVASILDK